MEKLKNIVSKIKRQSIFHQIIQSKHLKPQKFNQALQQFSTYSTEKQCDTLTQILSVFRKQRSTKIIIITLILIDYLHSLQPEITLFNSNSQPKILKQQSIIKKNVTINQKNFIAEEQFVKFYYQFLKTSSRKTSKQLDFLTCQLKQWIQYCQLSIKCILECIKVDFVFTYLLKHSSLVQEIKMALQSVFQKISFDIKIINKFLEKNLHLVTKKHQDAFRINQIYQKLLFIKGNFPKLNVVARQLTKKITFQQYQVDKQLNKQIQIEMYEREQQKKAYIASSRNKFQDIQSSNKQNQEGLTVEGQTMFRLNDAI